MAIISGGHIIEGATEGMRLNAGAPAAGTSAVQTLTIGGTPTGGTFKLSYEGRPTAAITWSATNATLLSNLNTALDALPHGGAGYIVATAASLTAGIGTISLTFSSTLARRKVSVLAVDTNSLTGTAPTLAIANTTPGVDPTAQGAPAGGLLVDKTNKKLYINTGTDANPVWTVVGSQT
jgi:hypothetical protein